MTGFRDYFAVSGAVSPDNIMIGTATAGKAALPANAEVIIGILQAQPELEFAVLIGSRATGSASPESDWDVALQWSPTLDWLVRLGYTETLRRQLAKAVGVAETRIDLIDLPCANLAMRASAAEEGKPLIGEESLAWARFLRRTWREIEEFYWDKLYAA
jgi:predicted nucleotidyltransferase